MSFRGSKSRNKVSVGEPAEGSLTNHRVLAFVLAFFKPHLCELFEQLMAFNDANRFYFVKAFVSLF